MGDTDDLKESQLSYQSHAGILNFVTYIKKFRDVFIEKKTCNVILTRRKDKQVQMLVLQVPYRSVEKINLKLHKTVNTMGNFSWGCCMLPYREWRSRIMVSILSKYLILMVQYVFR